MRGAALLEQARCTACHAPTLRTGPESALPELAPARPSTRTPTSSSTTWAKGSPTTALTTSASGREWWTAPLSASACRARQLPHLPPSTTAARVISWEAILRHGGERARSLPRDAPRRPRRPSPSSNRCRTHTAVGRHPPAAAHCPCLSCLPPRVRDARRHLRPATRCSPSIADNVCVLLARATADAQRVATAAVAFADAPSARDAATAAAGRRGATRGARSARLALPRARGDHLVRLRSTSGDAAMVERLHGERPDQRRRGRHALAPTSAACPRRYTCSSRATRLPPSRPSPRADCDAARRRGTSSARSPRTGDAPAAYAAAWDRAMATTPASASARAEEHRVHHHAGRRRPSVVNPAVAAVESVSRCGPASPGASDGGAPQSDRVESPYSDAPLTDLRAPLEGPTRSTPARSTGGWALACA